MHEMVVKYVEDHIVCTALEDHKYMKLEGS